MMKLADIENLKENTLEERLKKLRLKNGFTQAKIAEKLCMEEKSYQKYENGKTTPPFERIIQLCEIYKISSDYLLFGKKLTAAENITEILEKCPVEKQPYIEHIVQELVTAFSQS